MFKKSIAFILIICLMAPVFALDMKNAEPYAEDEFPKWTVNLRRGEILFFGSLPLTFAATTLGTSIAKSDMSFLPKLGIAAGVSTVIVLIDYFLGLGRNED